MLLKQNEERPLRDISCFVFPQCYTRLCQACALVHLRQTKAQSARYSISNTCLPNLHASADHVARTEGDDTTAVLLATAQKRQLQEFRLALPETDIAIPHGQRVAVILLLIQNLLLMF